MFHLVFALCVYLCSCVSIIHQIWTSNPESGSQRTKCSTFLCLLYLYVCVPILHQKCSNSGQVTHNQAPKCSTLYACISIRVIQLHQERSNSGPVTQRRIPTNQMFHLCICVVCVFVCRCSFTPTKVYTGSPRAFQFGTSYTEKDPNEPDVPPLYMCCLCICVQVFLYSDKSVYRIRLPTNQIFHLCMCVVCVCFYNPSKVLQFRTSYAESGSQRAKCSTFVCVLCASIVHQKCSNSGPVTQNQAPNESKCFTFISVCVYFQNPPKVFQFWTRCSTFVCVLCEYSCACVSIIYQGRSNPGLITQNPAPSEPDVSPLYVCCVCICVRVFL